MREWLFIPIFLFILPLAGTTSGFGVGNDASSQDSHYELGLKKLEAGKWEIALKVWLQGIVQMQESSQIDPRLRFSFIETACGHLYRVSGKYEYTNGER